LKEDKRASLGSPHTNLQLPRSGNTWLERVYISLDYGRPKEELSISY
jgi:hypothetical protein